ncbi:glycoside hydrolase family 2 [Cohnella endophytica]|uniref:Glycoside hydrolase family 2 n=1 Tax=Cohnella endophytica TaxID=2419778 RepID=A0A494XQL0_9BACL|nr:sugar-binding domain-containing protein [Cohnella endophytica]RKP52917.1 glycoside hydrolase family 2 [Cohnella endophytica]
MKKTHSWSGGSHLKQTAIRAEYPRPQFVRSDWLSLNGEWDFDYDDNNVGMNEGWHNEHPYSKKIVVPFCYQSKLSGIGETAFHDIVWYRRTFEMPDRWERRRLILHFGAVDYSASVWVNGVLVAQHEGGHTPFSADIGLALREGVNEIVVRAEDYSRDMMLPRGKQYWKEKSEIIFYTRTTGIWQSVWLEAVAATYLERVKFDPDIDRNEIKMHYFIAGLDAMKDNVTQLTRITFGEEVVAEEEHRVTHSNFTRTIALHDYNDHGLGRWWSPEHPNLYNVEFMLKVDGQIVDRVTSYFGMRKISVEHGKLCLNNRPYYMRLVLDQGYFPEGILTAPSFESLKADVELTKAMGFNGTRKHQKIEDPLFLYLCDTLGLLVWGEMANAYAYSEQYVERITQEWQEAIRRDYNHPCVVVWVPINESWGVPNILIDKQQQHHAMSMYHLTKSLDASRPVISNDGWEHVKSDLYTVHDYEWRESVLLQRYAAIEGAIDAPQKREMHVGGYAYDGEPVLVTEFGGIAFRRSEWEGWGYSGATSEEDFEKRLRAVFGALQSSPLVQGFCYTQITDVEQEINGLLTYDRKPKLPLETIRSIVLGQ